MIIKNITYYIFEEKERNSFKKWLKENNLSYSKLATIFNISRTYIYDMVNGRRSFKLEYLKWLKQHGLEIDL